MNLDYIISPIVGSIIGYTTNWLAIKMLFKPHKAYYLGKLRIPFTPGLIPRERERIAKSLGQAVGGNLLTEEVIMTELTNPKVIQSLKDYVLNDLLGDSVQINKVIEIMFGDETEFYNKVAQQIRTTLQEQLIEKRMMSGFIETTLATYLKQPVAMSQILGPKVDEKIDELLYENKVKIAHQICLFVAEDSFAEKVKSIIGSIVSEKMGGLAAMFIQPASIYGMLIDFVNSYFENEQNQDALVRGIIGIKNRGLNNSITSMMDEAQLDDIASQLNQLIHKKLADMILTDQFLNIVAALLKSIAEKPIPLTIAIKEHIEMIVEDNYRKFALTHLPIFLEQFNVTNVVETQINKFSVHEVEDLIFKIVDKELNAITWLGALLGFVMGTITLFF